MKNYVTENDGIYELSDQNLQGFIPSHRRKLATPDQLEALTRKLRGFYFNGGKVDKTKLKGFVEVSLSACK